MMRFEPNTLPTTSECATDLATAARVPFEIRPGRFRALDDHFADYQDIKFYYIKIIILNPFVLFLSHPF